MATITKKELVDRICDQTGQSRVKVKDTLQRFLEMVIQELGKGNRLEFRDFGVFEVKVRAARTAQNPKTLQPVRVPAKRTVKFKVGRTMRDHLAKISLDEAERETKQGKAGVVIKPQTAPAPAGPSPG